MEWMESQKRQRHEDDSSLLGAKRHRGGEDTNVGSQAGASNSEKQDISHLKFSSVVDFDRAKADWLNLVQLVAKDYRTALVVTFQPMITHTAGLRLRSRWGSRC